MRANFTRRLQEELDHLGIRVSLKNGSRHIKIYVDGRFAAVWPREGGTERSPIGEQNIVGQIRRAANGIFARGP